MSTTANAEDLCSRIEAMVQEHIAASRKAAIAALERAFSSDPSASTPKPRRQMQRAIGKHRSKEALNALQDQVYEKVSSNPGLGAAEMAKLLGISSKEMHRPMSKLKQAGLVRSVGRRSETRYFPISRNVPTLP